MRTYTLTIIYSFISLVTISQTDTLVVGNYSFAFKKSKIYYDYSQRGNIVLPSEYEKKETKGYVVNYKCLNLDEYVSETYSDGVQVLVKLGRDTTEKCKSGNMSFQNIIDTVNLKDVHTSSITPYIKSQKKTYYLCNANLYRLRKDTLTKCRLSSPENALDIDLNIEISPYDSLKDNLYILTDIYYRKGLTIYYLDKAVVIKINYR